MTMDILNALGVLRDQVRQRLLDNPEFRALVSIEHSIAEIEDAQRAHATLSQAQVGVETSPLSPPQPANLGRSLYERAMAQSQAQTETSAARQASPFLPVHKVA